MMRDGELWALTTWVRPIDGNGYGSWQLLPTPCATDYKGAGKTGQLRDRLDYAVERGATKSKTYWPTPRAGNPGSRPNGRGGKVLAAEVKKAEIFPTPKWSSAGPDFAKLDRSKTGISLQAHVALYPTPKTNGFCGGSGAKAKVDQNPELSIKEKRSMNAGNGGQLNPDWVEWLMGWPIGWTDLKPLETDRFRQWCASHGIPSPK
jgi:hypothetical protein